MTTYQAFEFDSATRVRSRRGGVRVPLAHFLPGQVLVQGQVLHDLR